MVQLKESTVKVRNKNSIDSSLVIQNTHDAIISSECFTKVQELMKLRTHRSYHQSLHLFTNVIFCSDCTSGMHYKQTRRGYVCAQYSKLGVKACSSHIVREKALIDNVLCEINKFVDDIKNSNLYDNLKSQLDNEIIQHQKYINNYECELESLKKGKLNLLVC